MVSAVVGATQLLGLVVPKRAAVAATTQGVTALYFFFQQTNYCRQFLHFQVTPLNSFPRSPRDITPVSLYERLVPRWGATGTGRTGRRSRAAVK